MVETNGPRLAKWPFWLGDVLLLAAAGWMAFRPGPGWEVWQMAMLTACVALGAWLAVTPFLVEFRAAVRFAEGDRLRDTVEQIRALSAVGDQVAAATARWQSVQESADKTAKTAREISDFLAAEARNFAESMAKTRDAEVRNLRLEVEKWQRGEAEWLQTLIRLLDQVFALHAAAVRSGQPALIEQLSRFQSVCRDLARRRGLVAIEAAAGTAFDPDRHALTEGATAVENGKVSQMLAPGYSYQGQVVRKPLVAVAASEGGAAAGAPNAQS